MFRCYVRKSNIKDKMKLKLHRMSVDIRLVTGTAEVGGADPAEGRGRWGVRVEFILPFVPSRRVESDRKTVSFPSSPDPFKTPSRTSPLLPYPPPERTSRDGSGKTPRCGFVFPRFTVVKDGITVLLRALRRPRDQAISWIGCCSLSGWKITDAVLLCFSS